MKVIKLRDSIYQLDFETQLELTSTLLRFQEHYESPKFRNKIFTLGEFKSWYSEIRGGFTYYSDWAGFNFPSHILDVFRLGLFDPLSEKEKEVLEILPASLNPYYVIGTYGGGDDGEVIKHEICHGLFYTNKKYHDKVLKIINKYRKDLTEVFTYIIEMGYNKAVLDDEAHAYLAVNNESLDSKGVKYPRKILTELKKLRKEFNI